MNYKILIWLLVLFSLSGLALAQEKYSIKLLAVQEDGNGKFLGSDADLYLELKPGSGRVFLETTPLTKLDTQLSTRFAKEIACDHFKLDCGNYDFFYTINADSSIIGGPSAGAAISALTTIAVLDLPYHEEVTLTGTINSGGIIGPVGGVKEKIDAAAEAGLKKVLIPKGTSPELIEPGSNSSVFNGFNNLFDYGKKVDNIEVVEVINLDEVIFHLTGLKINNQEIIVSENNRYTEIMGELQQRLCERTEKIESELRDEEVSLSAEIINEINERKEKVAKSSAQGNYYSAASFCFGNNIQLKTNYYKEKKASFAAVYSLFNNLDKKNNALEEEIGKERINTISDLQTLLIVKERINDVKQNIKEFQQNQEITADEMYSLLAYAEERHYSAVSWTEFFKMEGKEVDLDEERLRNSCIQKISESREREQYANLFLGNFYVEGINKKIALAEEAKLAEDYGLCLMTAAQAKADSNAILSTIGLQNETITDYLDSKRKAVERVISENSAEGIFPIFGYSYYQYANSLEEQDKITALVYMEYALEMSALDIYFPEEEKNARNIAKLNESFLDKVKFGLAGFAIGAALTGLIVFGPKLFRKEKKKKR